MATKRDVAAALVQLLAFACRIDIAGAATASERCRHELAEWSLRLAGLVLQRAGLAVLAAKDVAGDLAWAILRGQNLHAAAKQAAAAAAVLASPEQQAGLSAHSLGRFRLRAGLLGKSGLFLLAILVWFVKERGDHSLEAALLAALRESRLLEHTGRLLLLLPPGAAEEPASEDLAEAQRSAHLYLCHTVLTLRDILQSAGSSPGSELRPLLGTCGLHALLALGASALAEADGGPCGLPRDPLLRQPFEADLMCANGEVIVGFAFSLTADVQSSAPSLSARARIRLLVRLLQLAGASARAYVGRRALVRTPDGKWVVDLSWGGGRRQRSQEFARLLGPGRIGAVAGIAISELIPAFASSPRAWAAEAGSILPALLTGARHCLAGPQEDADPRVKLRLLGSASRLLTTIAAGIRTKKQGKDASRNHHGYALCLSPAKLPAPMAAALEGGVVPLLETLLCAAGDDPAGPEGHMSSMVVWDYEPCTSLTALLVHSPPRQAAAFLATLAKLLRRTPPGALLEPLPPKGGPLPPGAWLTLISQLMILQHSMAASSGLEPPSPVDPSAPCSTFFVFSLAALQLLPVVSRLTREAAQLAGAGSATVGRSGREPDGSGRRRPPDPIGLLTDDLLSMLSAALGPGAPHPPRGSHQASPPLLSTALCLPFLVEEAGAVPLLGALLAALLRDGELPGVRPTPSDLLVPLAQCCVGVAQAYPERVWEEGGGGSAGAVGSSGAPASVSASAAWSPAALRLLASRLRGSGPPLSEEVEALAAWLEQPPPTAEPPQEGSPIAAELAAAAERLAALRAEVRAVLPPACSHPACVSLAGDSEAGRRRQQCGRCGRASYCCRECQLAHWKAGHKAACGGGAEGGGSKTG